MNTTRRIKRFLKFKGGYRMIEYLQELRVKDGNNIRIIGSHIFKKKHMTDEELEAKKVEFSKHMLHKGLN